MAGFKDHFSDRAAAYAAHRPSYPDALAAHLARLAPGRGLALDCGCGTGQLAQLLAGHFERVVATDASVEQIGQAGVLPNLAFRVAPAEASGLPPGSADLVTAAQAAHWFDLPAFYAEVRRVARPGAVLALVSYGIPHLDGAPGEVVAAFYRDLGPCWPPERRHVEEGYRGLPFPFAELPQPALAIERDRGLDDLVGYVATWSAVAELERRGGASRVAAFRQALAEHWGDPATRRRVTWPLSMRLGRVEAD
ncbi:MULTISPECIES: class I SAM-dependent methyltransferase [Methylobacterium]|uniref:Trans-aconitate 2-methyltransferase n=1 Tax=Methylobacterium jeotgali TaxID=381630 RepID=A0ABQ4SQZ9_9HYPH|nr:MULTISPECIES: class I SAM-dependent methyltransferase [Methylobacterium]PIU04293.1 MAG: SAM-dependent methyltransferase [Methylobacterium sp. CG09_land_8_20_14_0_10_71_15]PIU11557.1 MAG: SAM-dependent methyltransferase [Methylobacterium sp. CG08_land_8_20_14_0_20_71_15]GBU16632.1 hypothetical protein AwMethylo_08470 [Methylobacterium sp.]GJE05572.1 Trans-aconitate 2-methyltransferase [Methylobacterium jeotgali]